jgi:hypothetical protein
MQLFTGRANAKARSADNLGDKKGALADEQKADALYETTKY